jgi:hypothetical protein
MSKTKKTANNNVSNNNIIIINDKTLFDSIVFQLDNKQIGIIIVVNNTKYIDIPSIPKYISK